MLILGPDILSQHLFPNLDLKSLLALRQTSAQLQTTIDNCGEWRRRYRESFPFDSRCPDGNGLERYVKRCRARLKINEGTLKSNSTGPFMGIPVVDFSVVCFPALPHAERRPHEVVDAFLARLADGRVFIHTSQYVRAIVYTDGVTRLNLAFPSTYLRGWKDDMPMKFDVRKLDVAKVEPFKVHHCDMQEAEIEVSRESQDILNWLNKHPQAYDERRLDSPHPSTIYYGLVVGRNIHKVISRRRPPMANPSIEGLFSTILKRIPRCPDTLRVRRHYLEAHILVCSIRETVYVVSPTFPFQSPSASYKVASFQISNPVETIDCECVLKEDGIQISVDLLDVAGNFESYIADAPTGDVWNPKFRPRCPQNKYVTEMVDDILLFEDGTIWNHRTFQCVFDESYLPRGKVKLVTGVLMVSLMLYLAED